MCLFTNLPSFFILLFFLWRLEDFGQEAECKGTESLRGGAVFSALASDFSIFERLLLRHKAVKRRTAKNVFRRKMLENCWIKEY